MPKLNEKLNAIEKVEIDVPLYYCKKHKEYYSYNCSECACEISDLHVKQVVCKAIGDYIDRIHKNTDNRITWIWEEGTLMEALRQGKLPMEIR